MPLNDMQCRQCVGKIKLYRLYDNSGLYLEIMPTGTKIWRLKYRIFDKEKRYTLGPYPAISLVKAREKRDSLKEDIRNGIDPSLIKLEKKRLARFETEQTFQLIAEQWHKHYYETWTKNHADSLLYRLKQNVFPFLGNLPISKITPPMILSCIQKIEERKTTDLPKRVLTIIGQVFRYAVVTGRAERDYTRDLKGALKKTQGGHYAAISGDELPALLLSIKENKKRLYEQTVYAIRFLLLTFVRTNELINAKWDEINLEKAEWNIPAERMKMKNPHFVPLSKQAIDILKALKELHNNKTYVFPSISKPNQTMSSNTILMALNRMGYTGRMTGHGFRALAMSTIKEKLGYQHEVIDRQLAHLPRNKVAQAYDRATFIPQRKIMMQDWADYIDKISN